LLPYRELDDVLGLTGPTGDVLIDTAPPRTDDIGMTGLFCQSVSVAFGYDDRERR
jgi:hypothetical protein